MQNIVLLQQNLRGIKIETRHVARLSRAEQETCITWLYDDECIELYTSDCRVITKCDRAGYEVLVEGIDQGCPEQHRIVSKTYKVPVKAISFRKLSGMGKPRGNGGNVDSLKGYWNRKKDQP